MLQFCFQAGRLIHVAKVAQVRQVLSSTCVIEPRITGEKLTNDSSTKYLTTEIAAEEVIRLLEERLIIQA